MIQKEEQLLLKDLCLRLPYGVKIKLNGYDYQVCGYNSAKEKPVKVWYYYNPELFLKSYIDIYLTDYKPYLRPMSSMTEEEKQEYEATCSDWYETQETYDWLNAHHFDHLDLISKGLAIEAPENMYM